MARVLLVSSRHDDDDASALPMRSEWTRIRCFNISRATDLARVKAAEVLILDGPLSCSHEHDFEVTDCLTRFDYDDLRLLVVRWPHALDHNAFLALERPVAVFTCGRTDKNYQGFLEVLRDTSSKDLVPRARTLALASTACTWVQPYGYCWPRLCRRRRPGTV